MKIYRLLITASSCLNIFHGKKFLSIIFKINKILTSSVSTNYSFKCQWIFRNFHISSKQTLNRAVIMLRALLLLHFPFTSDFHFTLFHSASLYWVLGHKLIELLLCKLIIFFFFTLLSCTVSSNIPSKDFFTESVPSPKTFKTQRNCAILNTVRWCKYLLNLETFHVDRRNEEGLRRKICISIILG